MDEIGQISAATHTHTPPGPGEAGCMPLLPSPLSFNDGGDGNPFGEKELGISGAGLQGSGKESRKDPLFSLLGQGCLQLFAQL